MCRCGKSERVCIAGTPPSLNLYIPHCAKRATPPLQRHSEAELPPNYSLQA